MYLLDTQVLLWYLNDDPRLKPTIKTLISDPKHRVFASAVTAWEMVIKKGLGKLEVPDNIEALIVKTGFEILEIRFHQIMAVATLPKIHNDPFDRLLIAQAKVENLIFITRDEKNQEYPIVSLLA